ncbi:AAA family ATPase [Pseudomonas sp. AMR01]|uniref:AAA family ATPase n=1 Tax=Pseudomonas sp. AMR01 TaxID=3064904 RepID=UPI0035C125F9
MPSKIIEALIQELLNFKPGAPLLHYITHARFPNFKGLEPGSRIEFPFPLTALVGANGIGKSSVLHALQGMPDGETTAKFWFSTAMDPISTKVQDPPRYIYGHWHQTYKDVVETRKARIYSKKRDYEYWEPTKVTKGDDMLPMPEKPYARKDKDRWNPVQKTVVYMNMKVIIGAFDRTFNFGTSTEQIAAKHAEMRAGARKLKSVIDRNASSWMLGGGRERVFENRLLTDEELAQVSKILGRPYQSAQYIKHSLYPEQKGGDISVVFDRGFKYSEAFAGSGEIAIVTLVVRIISAPKYSLVLLDEPETSLHPGAQRELLIFLLSEIKKKHLQIVISTHSFDFIQDLPPNALKVFEDNGTGKTRVLNECSPFIALNRLGKTLGDKKRIYVEDPLAKAVVERAMEGLDLGEQSALEIVVAPGGANGIVCKQIPTHITAESDCYVFLDGDQRVVQSFTDPASLAPLDHRKLEDLIFNEMGCRPQFPLNGGNDVKGNAKDKVTHQLAYLGWVRLRLDYLPQKCPDAILLSPPERKGLVTSEDFKKALHNKIGHGQTAEGFLGVVRYLLAALPDGNADLSAVRATLKRWLAVPS